MSRKQFFLVLLALAIVGGAGLVLLKRDQQTWAANEAKVGDVILPGFSINSVESIHVKGVVDFNLLHTNGIWRVDERYNYPANFARVSDLLIKIRDLKVVQSDLIGPSQLPRLYLNAPGNPTNGGTLFEFKDGHGKILASLLVGKKHDKPQDLSEPIGLHGMFDGCYVLLPNEPQNALVASDELAAADPQPRSWLNRDFFKVEHIRLISLVAPNPDDSWEISRDNDSSPWVLNNAKPGEVLNTNVVYDPGEILAFPEFDDVAPQTSTNMAALGLDKPIVVTVVTENLAYTLKVGPKLPNGERAMTVAIAGNILPARVADPNEQPEDKAKLDAEFEKKNEDLRKILARGQSLAPWIYEAGSWIEMVLHVRSDLLEKTTLAAGQTAQQ
jgi:hypothetical protein